MPSSYLDPDTLARLEGLDVQARMIVEGTVSGQHRSPFHGFSIEFAEHREYVPGDDLRYVDWKVYGKSDRFYLKQYEAETNFACYLVVDASESMRYRSPGALWSKLDYARYLAASLAYVVLRQQDAVGLVTFDTEIRQFLRAGSQPAQLQQICHGLEQASGSGETGIGPILHNLAEQIRRRGLVILLSDLFDEPAGVLDGLKHLKFRRHDVHVWHILDPAEEDFPFTEPTLFKGLEGLPSVMTDPRALQRAYTAEFRRFIDALRAGCQALHMPYARLRTDVPLELALAERLASR